MFGIEIEIEIGLDKGIGSKSNHPYIQIQKKHYRCTYYYS